MYWICLSLDEVNILLSLLNQERELVYDEEEHGLYAEFTLAQKHIQDLYEKLLFVLEHEK